MRKDDIIFKDEAAVKDGAAIKNEAVATDEAGINEADFLKQMWNKAETKEANIKIYEMMTRERPMDSFADFMVDMVQGVGLREIFAGMADVTCVAFAVTLLIFWAGYQMLFQDLGDVYSIAFLGAPILYGVVFLLSWLKESQMHTYNVQMSCKYTFFHLLAFRMFVSSLGGMAVNSLYITFLKFQYSVSFIRLFTLSFSSLMLFSVLLMICLTVFSARAGLWGAMGLPALWLIVNVFIYWYFDTVYTRFLQSVPVWALAVAAAMLSVIYIRGLLRMTTIGFRKGYADAAGESYH